MGGRTGRVRGGLGVNMFWIYSVGISKININTMLSKRKARLMYIGTLKFTCEYSYLCVPHPDLLSKLYSLLSFWPSEYLAWLSQSVWTWYWAPHWAPRLVSMLNLIFCLISWPRHLYFSFSRFLFSKHWHISLMSSEAAVPHMPTSF